MEYRRMYLGEALRQPPNHSARHEISFVTREGVWDTPAMMSASFEGSP
jgi:hypothetical protein